MCDGLLLYFVISFEANADWRADLDLAQPHIFQSDVLRPNAHRLCQYVNRCAFDAARRSRTGFGRADLMAQFAEWH